MGLDAKGYLHDDDDPSCLRVGIDVGGTSTHRFVEKRHCNWNDLYATSRYIGETANIG